MPTPTSELMIIDVTGAEVADGDIGEILLRTPAMFLGYFRDDTPPVDADGWYHTGDFGRIDDGLLYVESRLRDMIMRGGENIYPIEIEDRLLSHPDILEAAVIGVPHRELGQEVMAVIVTRGGVAVSPDEVRAFVAAKLARFKVPAQVRVVDVMPQNASGKIVKQELRDRFATEASPDGLPA